MALNFPSPASDSLKWRRWAGRDVLPLWVADLDCQVAPVVQAALQQRLAHGVFGYSLPDQAATAAAVGMLARHGWTVDPAWLVWLPGLVTGIAAACRVGGGPVTSTTPIYPPFLTVPRQQGLEVRAVPLLAGAVHDLERLPTPAGTTLLCLPHNPTGRVFTTAELAALGSALSSGRGVVVSDEAWADLVLDPACRHVPLALAAPQLLPRLIALYSPAKAFNLPGLGCALAVVPDAALRQRFWAEIRTMGAHPGPLGYAGTAAAWSDGWAWLDELKDHLRQQTDRAMAVLSTLPKVRVQRPEATFLLWLDLRAVGPTDPAAWLLSHGLGLSDGAEFDAPGFVRLNLGCSPKILDEALARLARAVTSLG